MMKTVVGLGLCCVLCVGCAASKVGKAGPLVYSLDVAKDGSAKVKATDEKCGVVFSATGKVDPAVAACVAVNTGTVLSK